MAPRREKVVTVQRLMAVIDKPEAASLAAGALVREGFPAEAITVLHGDRDADRVDSLGKMSGPWRKLWRAVQFTQADQMVDLVMYEAALRDGRAVIALHARRAEDRERAKRVLAAAGAHFMNYFGRLSTEDISRWRGKELPRHPNLYR
jgi:cell division inhibitor SulA